ncbi:13839_t:CDS:2 [Cetraspora pellucida]|uniref:13839_t:CDS:1 n=1 Tax=Cetraspora pellucida TaxID=1433469 RepID=A0ACA9KQG3_9GLOM|nr:13839_t:CDS:2 [Cetraspora pellucida]
MYREEDLSEKGVKKDLVERLVDRVLSKAKGKDKVVDDTQAENVDEMRMDRTFGNADGFGYEGTDEIRYRGYGGYMDFNQQYVAFERSIKKTMQAMMEKPRDQFEYDEWCKVSKYLDDAILGNNWDIVLKTQEVVATRAFMLKVAN